MALSKPEMVETVDDDQDTEKDETLETQLDQDPGLRQCVENIQRDNEANSEIMRKFYHLGIDESYFYGHGIHMNVPKWIDLLKCVGCKSPNSGRGWYMCDKGHYLCYYCAISYENSPDVVGRPKKVCPHFEYDQRTKEMILCSAVAINKGQINRMENLRLDLLSGRHRRYCYWDENCSYEIYDGMGGDVYEDHILKCDYRPNKTCPFSNCWESGLTAEGLAEHLKNNEKTNHGVLIVSSGTRNNIKITYDPFQGAPLPNIDDTPKQYTAWPLPTEDQRKAAVEQQDWAPLIVQVEDNNFMLRVRKAGDSMWIWLERIENKEPGEFSWKFKVHSLNPKSNTMLPWNGFVIPGYEVPETMFHDKKHHCCVPWPKILQYANIISSDQTEETLEFSVQITVERV